MKSRFSNYTADSAAILRMARCSALVAKREVIEPRDLLVGLVAGCELVSAWLEKEGWSFTPEYMLCVLECVAFRSEANVGGGTAEVSAVPGEPGATVVGKAGADDGGGRAVPAVAMPLCRLESSVDNVLKQAEAMATGGAQAKVQAGHIWKAAWPLVSPLLCEHVRDTKGGQPSAESFEPKEYPGLVMARPVAPAKSAALSNSMPAFLSDLSAKAPEFPLIGRENEIDAIIAALLRKTRRNVLLLGEAGVGKSAIVAGFAQKISRGEVPEVLRSKRVLAVSVTELAANTGTYGALEKRIKELTDYVEQAPDAILFFDECQQFVRRNDPENSVFEYLKPLFGSGKVGCIACTTHADYQRVLKRDAALARRFMPVMVEEPGIRETEGIMRQLIPHFRDFHKVHIAADLASSVVRIAGQYLKQRRFPAKAIDLLDDAAVNARLRGAPAVEDCDLLGVVRRMTGIAVDEVGSGVADILGTLEQKLEARVLGQSAAIRRVVSVVRLCKYHLDLHPERPRGVFLFVGPTGVGKTELSSTLAECLGSGDRNQFYQINCAELGEEHKLSRLTGSPPGYVGNGEESELARVVARVAGGVLLLDELEKAHSNFHRLLLSILDCGRVTDSSGSVLDFSGMTIIATTNVPIDVDKGPMGFAAGNATAGQALPGQRHDAVAKALMKFFPAELIGRFDAIVPFNSISRAVAGDILDKSVLVAVNRNLAEQHGLRLVFTPAVKEMLLDNGYSAALGVRHLHHTVETLVLMPLAERLAARGAGGRARGRDHEVAELLVTVGADNKLVISEPAEATLNPLVFPDEIKSDAVGKAKPSLLKCG